MIAYLKGKTIYHGANFLVIDTGGVGYKVYVVPDLLSAKSAELYVRHITREDTSDLYGFETQQQLNVFELLLEVSGVGPKVALALIAGLGAQRILSAISAGDASVFKSIPGVGNKVAAKIIVELKSKVTGGAGAGPLLPEEDETVDALVSLGYRKHEIIPYLKDIPESANSTQEKIKFVLKNVGRSRK